MDDMRFLPVLKEHKIAWVNEDRVIMVNGEITDFIAGAFVMELNRLEKEDRFSDITVLINSPGGSIAAGWAMIDAMNRLSCDVSTVCLGMAASMGAMLLMSGSKGKRLIFPHSRVLIHQPLGGTQGQAADIEIYTAEIKRTREELYSWICEQTGQNMEKVASDCDRNYIMTATEALDYGIVDRILNSQDSIK